MPQAAQTRFRAGGNTDFHVSFAVDNRVAGGHRPIARREASVAAYKMPAAVASPSVPAGLCSAADRNREQSSVNKIGRPSAMVKPITLSNATATVALPRMNHQELAENACVFIQRCKSRYRRPAVRWRGR